jgi:hypothetical protein
LRAGFAAAAARKKMRNAGIGHKKDANHNEIVKELERNGVFVLDLSTLGGGAPDVLCWVNWFDESSWQTVEIKNPKTGYGRRGANKNQKKWADGARRSGCVVWILSSIEEATNFALGNLRGIKTIAEDALVAIGAVTLKD